MQASTRAELRHLPRRTVGVSQLLTVDVVAESGSAQHGLVLDLSEGGAALQLLGKPRESGVSTMRLHLPALETPLETGARLAWLAPGGRVGIQFNNVPDRTREALREFLDTQTAQGSLATTEAAAEFSPDLDDFGATLGIIAERAMARTGAKGAAIAVGNRECMICCASVGEAPTLYALIQPDSSLSGTSLREGVDLYCMDAKTDSRVDPVVAEQLKMRSAVMLPVTVSGRIAGILALFSDEPNAFGASTTRDRLGRLLQFLAAALQEFQSSEAVSEMEGEDSNSSEAAISGENSASEEAQPAVEQTEAAADLPLPGELLRLEPQDPIGVPGRVIVVFTLLVLAAALLWYFFQKNQGSVMPKDTQPYNTAVSANVPAVIALSPSSVSVRGGDPFSIDVVLSDGQNLSSIGLIIAHDPNVLKVVGVSAGDLLGPAGTIVHREQPGQLQITASVAPPAAAISGRGVLCTVYFLAKERGASTLSISDLAVRDSSMRPARSQSTDANVTVTR